MGEGRFCLEHEGQREVKRCNVPTPCPNFIQLHHFVVQCPVNPSRPFPISHRPSIAQVPRPLVTSHVPCPTSVLSSRLPPTDPHLSPRLDLARLLQRYHIQGFHRPFSEWPAELRYVRHAPSMDVLNQERISLPGGVEIFAGDFGRDLLRSATKGLNQDRQRPPPSSSMQSTASFSF